MFSRNAAYHTRGFRSLFQKGNYLRIMRHGPQSNYGKYFHTIDVKNAIPKNSASSMGIKMILCGATLGSFLLYTTRNEAHAKEDIINERKDITNVVDASQSPKWQEARKEGIKHLRILKEKMGTPGIVGAVLIDGEIVFAEGVGYSDVENLVQMTPQTPLRIASISKALTAAAVALLSDQGKLDVNAPVEKYVPHYKYTVPSKDATGDDNQKSGQPTVNSDSSEESKNDVMTVKHLGGHLSGIRHYKGDEFRSKVEYKTVADALAIFKDEPLQSAPGEKYNYTSHGFTVLSAVIEGASGVPFTEFMKKNVFWPLKMFDTHHETHAKIVSHRARYYIRETRPKCTPILRNAPWVDNSMKWAGGGFVSTVLDLARFGHAMLNGDGVDKVGKDFIKKETIENLLWTSQADKTGKKTNYGLGFVIHDVESVKKHFKSGKTKKIVSHSGSACGGSTHLVLIPDDKCVVVLMTNIESAPKLLGKSIKLADIFLHQEEVNRLKSK